MTSRAAETTTWYLFSVNVDTPPAMAIDSGQEVTLVVRGAFADVGDIRDVPTPFTPACDGHPLTPIAGPVHRGAEPGDAAERPPGECLAASGGCPGWLLALAARRGAPMWLRRTAAATARLRSGSAWADPPGRPAPSVASSAWK
jgi:hypothetical protein